MTIESEYSISLPEYYPATVFIVDSVTRVASTAQKGAKYGGGGVTGQDVLNVGTGRVESGQEGLVQLGNIYEVYH